LKKSGKFQKNKNHRTLRFKNPHLQTFIFYFILFEGRNNVVFSFGNVKKIRSGKPEKVWENYLYWKVDTLF